MNLKSKILAAGLAVIIAGGAIGIAVFSTPPKLSVIQISDASKKAKAFPTTGWTVVRD